MGRSGKDRIRRRHLFTLLALAVLLGGFLLPLSGSTQVQAAQPSLTAMESLPLAFEPNVGQTDGQVRFLIHAPRAILHFTPSELVLMLAESSQASGGASRNDPDWKGSRSAAAPRAVSMGFVGANSSAQVIGQAPLPGVVNYLLGSDPSKWRTQTPTYGEIVYQDLYPGIDLSYSGQTGQLKGTYTVAPGADPTLIRWRYQGGDQTSVTAAGALEVRVSSLTVTEHTPVAWQEKDGQRVPVSATYDLAADGSISFQLGAYDQNLPLVIDPTLTYATFLGGTAGDEARGVAVDSAGNMYVAGYTASTNFPTKNPRQGNQPLDDVFVTKLSANGSSMIFSTYLGGNAIDRAWAMTIDGGNNVLLTGLTESTNFPTTAGAYDRTRGGTGASGVDAFVTKLKSDGSALLFSTYLGGAACDASTGTIPEWGFAIAANSANQVYVTGLTLCSDFPTTANAFQATPGGVEDAFISKFSADGSQLLYSTYMGGGGLDWAEGLKLDDSGYLYITGRTTSSNFPVKNAYQPTTRGNMDAFVAKLNTTASGAASLMYSTYLGGPGTEKAYGIDVDGAGNAFIAGMTDASGFPTTSGAFDRTYTGGGSCPDGDTAGDAFVTKLNAAGNALVYSTYLGGSSCDAARDVEIDGAGNAYVAGWTDSTAFPLASPIQTSLGGGEDAFVSKLNAAGSALVYSTYLGGSNHDYARRLVVDSAGAAYVVGQAHSGNFPATGNALFPNRGGGDAFIAKISEPISSVPLPRAWYFAEGYTGEGFDEFLSIQNPNNQAGVATITYYLEGAAPVVRHVPLQPTSRTTVQVHKPVAADNPGGYGRTAPGQGISAKVEANLGIVVERPMYFTYAGGLPGGSDVMGVNAPRQSWLFAEGYTGAGFDEFLTIMNPNSTDAAVTITYFLGSGAPITKHLTVPGSRRHTVIVHETAEGVGRNQAVSARVTTTNPGGIVVERPMYFNYGGWSQGGDTVMGAAETHTTWYFPDGDTRPGADTYLTIMNPTGTNAQVAITYYTGGGATQVKTIQAPANSRYTVQVHEAAEGVGRGKTPSIKVASTNGVGLVVERPIYKEVGGDNVMGAPQANKTWLFAEGWTGQGFSESLVLLNPTNSAAPVTITYYLAGGGTVEKSVSVGARGRQVINVNGASEGVGPNQPVSAKVSATNAGGIVVERSMTFTYGSIPGYHAVLGYAP